MQKEHRRSEQFSLPNRIQLETNPVDGSLKPSIVAGIVVTILIFLVVSAIKFIWHRRRHSFMRAPQPRAGAESRLDPRSIFPFALPTPTTSSWNRDAARQTITDKHNVSVSRPLAQRVLQNELDAVRDKVVELEEQEMRLAGPVSESVARQRWRSDSIREVPEEAASQGDLAVQLQAAREEITLLVRRIDELNADNAEVLAFGWGRSRENEPPPDYE
ncbi:hypothetical protein R3P38DRAFT_3581177 [Favolaschia claudopus]|uniref:Uncharacterized protein n=1 Tax=Favolaschia claudopus TaxID=2862362 RepID=A0AAW0ALS3_9AGAR